MLLESLFHNLTLVNPGVFLLEYSFGIRGMRNARKGNENLVINFVQVVSWPHFGG